MRALIASLVALVFLGMTGIALAHDFRLDDADAALVKAEALLLGSTPSNPSPKADREVERRIKRAIDAIENARDQIQAAITADDNL